MKYILLLFFIVIMGVPSIGLAQQSQIEVAADNALEWDRDAQIFTATGNATISQNGDVLTAPEIMASYSETDGQTVIEKVTAKNNAVFTRANERLTSQTIIADFKGGNLDVITANKNVVLKTDNETLYGDRGVYDAINRVIVITGNVRIEQGQNILTGSRAEMDLNTNISKITASPNQNNGRVKAIFFANEAQ